MKDETVEKMFRITVATLLIGGMVIWVGMLSALVKSNADIEDFCREQGYMCYDITESNDYFCYDPNGDRQHIEVECGIFSGCEITKGETNG